MTVLTVRGLDEETLRALRVRAAENRQSMEAELRAIIRVAVMPAGRLLLGSALAVAGRMAGSMELYPLLNPLYPLLPRAPEGEA